MQFLLGAYDFPVNSRYTPNADMETNSHWVGSGPQTSAWFSTNRFFMGSRSLAWNITSGFEVASYHLAGSSGKAWDCTQSRQLDGNFGATNATSEAIVGNYATNPFYYYRDASFGFRFPVAIPAGTQVTEAYLSVKCSSGGSPIVFDPRISTLHSVTAYDGTSNYINTGWYVPTTTHQTSFAAGQWYYGKGQNYAFNMAPALQAAINSKGGLTQSDWINVTMLGGSASTGQAMATFFQDGGYGPTSDTAFLNVAFISGTPAEMGSNFILHASAADNLYPGSAYAVEGAIYIESGGMQFSARVMTSDASSALATFAIEEQIGNWNRFSHVFSVTAVASSPRLHLGYGGAIASLVFFDEVGIADAKDLASLGVIEIYPEWEMRRYRKRMASEHRGKTGTLYAYTWGHYERFEIPLQNVAANKAMIINSWWRTADMFMLKIESGGVWETNSLACVNKQEPFQQFEKGYIDQMQGTLELETF